MKLIVEFVRRELGEAAVVKMLALSGDTRPLSVLEDEQVWSSYDQKIALFEAAAQVSGKPDIAYDIGETVLDSSVGSSLKIALGLLGSPATLLRAIPRTSGKFSTAGDMAAVEVSSTQATLRYRVREGYQLSRYDCDYSQGLLTQVPVMFGLPPARVEHPECQIQGAPDCIYHLTWNRRSRMPWKRRHRNVAVDALFGRLTELQATVSDLVVTTGVEDVLDAIAARAGSAVNAERFVLAARMDASQPARVRSDGFAEDEAGRMASHLLAERPVELEGHRTLMAEVRTSNRSYGWLAVFSRFGFLDHEVDLLSSYARLAATALEAVTAVAEAEERRRIAEALVGLAGHLHRAHTREDIAAAVADAARAVVGADAAAALLFGADEAALQAFGTSGLPGDLDALAPQVRITPDDTESFSRLLAQPDIPRIFTEDSADPYLLSLMQSFRMQTLLSVSLRGANRVHGVLVAGWSTGSAAPDVADTMVANLQALGDQATNALDKAELLEQVRRQASTDDLTGVANRRRLGDRLEEVLSKRASAEAPALLFIDLDGFKPINDTFGHAAGDAVLRETAARLRRCVRPEDLVARLGGDEFTVLLSSVPSASGALQVAEELRQTLSEPAEIEGHWVEVRSSIGVIMVEPGVHNADEVLRNADAAMYGAKKAGGGRCALFRPDQAPHAASLSA